MERASSESSEYSPSTTVLYELQIIQRNEDYHSNHLEMTGNGEKHETNCVKHDESGLLWSDSDYSDLQLECPFQTLSDRPVNSNQDSFMDTNWSGQTSTTIYVQLDSSESDLENQNGEVSTSSTIKGRRRCSKKKNAYRHVPHKEKPPQVVAKRNARERRRVHAVNMAFIRLRKAIPLENKRGKRISKVRVLQKAIDHIQNLYNIIRNFDGEPAFSNNHSLSSDNIVFAF